MKKKNKILLAVLLAAFAASNVALATSCRPADPGNNEIQSGETVTEGEETGIYYYDSADGEYQINLYGGDAFTAALGNGNQYGTYAAENGVLSFTFAKTTTDTLSATYANGVLTVVYNGGTMVFLRKQTYTVTFSSNGGSAVAGVPVVNGKTLAKPEDPVREGYIFIGWYTDAQFTQPFLFGTQAVTSDITLYAQWAERTPGQSEFLVKLDPNYDGAAVSTLETINGKLYDLPSPERAGYTFAGWWVSMYNDASKLSLRYTSDMTFEENSTLYAVWQSAASGTKLSSPLVEIGDSTITWNTVSGATAYQLVIARADGTVVEEQTIGANRYSFRFADYDAGDYTVSVTAVASSSGNNSDAAVLYYKNKALARVSRFTVLEGDTLLFDGVSNAQKYYITVECGNEEHNHTNLDNGVSTTFDFSNCEMQEGGIRFTVTAVANGYASSVSETFVYTRALSAVSGLTFDESTQRLVWNAVENAADYVVSIGDGEREYVTESIGNNTSYSLKNYSGTIVVNVYPRTKGYNSPAATTLTIQKTMLATPADLTVEGDTLRWSAVEGATSYEVSVGGKTYPVAEATELDLSTVLETKGGYYEVTVRAIGAENSAWSDAVPVRYLSIAEAPLYHDGVVVWEHVAGAELYEIKVNDEEAIEVKGANYAAITLTKRGENLISVRFYDGEEYSEWATTVVYAYAVYFNDGQGGSLAPVYRAVGDAYALPEAEREGYDFSGWYNAPDGPANNGKIYADDDLFDLNGDIVVYAYWQGRSYTVTLDGSGGESSDPTQVVFGSSYALPVPTNEDTRYVFAGWYDKESGGVQLTDATGKSLNSWGIATDTTLYAHWHAIFKFTQLSDSTYSVSMGADIGRVKEIVVPATYNGRSVTVVDGYAFRFCANLTSISIPNTIRLVESTAFYYCTSLSEVNVYEVEGVRAPVYKSSDGALIYNDPLAGEWAMAYYPVAKTGEYVVPDGVVSIPLKTFASTYLTKITIPSSVTSIGANAFYNCQKLTTVIFAPAADGETGPDLTIAASAFSGCRALVEVTLPARIVSLDISLFSACTTLEYINIEEGNPYYCSLDGFLCTADKRTLLFCPAGRRGEVTIPVGVEVIGESAFYGCTKITSVVIPFYVTTIEANAFSGCYGMTQLTFQGGSSVKQTIGASAFADCWALTEITFEEDSNVTEIGENAFYFVYGLVELTLPKSLEHVGAGAFSYMNNLVSVTFANGGTGDITLEDSAFYQCSKLQAIYLSDNFTRFSSSIFANCTNISKIEVDENNETFTARDNVLYTKDVSGIVYYPTARMGAYTVPSTVTSIADYAFANCIGLTDLYVSKSVTSIGEYAFYNCISLLSVEFESGGTEELVIGMYAFANATALTEVILPDTLIHIPDYMFSNMPRLINVTMGANVKTIGDYAFYKTGVVSFDFSGIESIGDYAFALTYLTAAEFSDSLEEIGDYAFNASKLTKLILPANLTSYGTNIYTSCTMATEIVIETGVTAIPSSAFSGCTNVKQLEIPSSVTTIGMGAFSSCSALTSVTIPSSVTSIGSNAFYSCSQATLTFEENGTESLTIGSNAFYNFGRLTNGFTLALPARTVSLGNYAFTAAKITGSVTIPAAVTSLGESTFQSCTGITEVIFEDGDAPLEISGKFLYGATALTSVQLSDRVVSIGASAFYGCSQLQSITITENVTTIDTNVFTGCTSLTEFSVDEKNVNYALSQNVLYQLDATTDADGKTVYVKTVLQIALPVASGDIVLPNTVTTIYASAFSGNKMITSFTYEEGREEKLAIGAQAFSGCTALKTVSLPALSSLESKAFYNCTSLTSLLLAEGGTEDSLTIGEYAFNGDPIETLTIPAYIKTIDKYAFYNCTSLTSLTFAENSRLKTISNYAFQGATITSLVLPDSVTTISNYAFKGCTALTSVTLPANLSMNLTSGTYNYFAQAFSGCSALESLAISEKSEDYAVYDNALYTKDMTRLIWVPFGITELIVPEGVTTIGSLVAAESNLSSLNSAASKLTSVTLPSTLTEIRTYAFAMSSLQTINFAEDSDRLLTIAARAFHRSDITSVSLPANVFLDGTEIFYLCSSLTQATFADGGNVTEIPADTFASCTKLVSVTLPDTLQTIGEEAFYYCTSLRSITIPRQVSSIGKMAFQYTSALSVVFEEDSACSTLSYAFYGSGLTSIVLPDHLASTGSYAFSGCTSLTSIDLPEGLATIDINAFYNCSLLRSVTFPETLTSINSSAFAGCSKLTNVVLPSKLATIGNYAFLNCTSIKEIELPDTLTTLGDQAFNGCKALVTVTIPASITSLGAGLFKGCTSLTGVDYLYAGQFELPATIFQNCTLLTSFTYAGVLTAIGSSAFNGCTALVSFEMGDEVTTIGNYAFANCKKLVLSGLSSPLTSIGQYAFQNCAVLAESLELPESITAIGQYAFAGCTGLQELVTNEGLLSIGNYAFSDCTNLKNFSLYEGVLSIGNFAFNNCTALTVFYLPASITTIGSNPFLGCSNLEKIEVAAGNINYLSADNVVYNAAMTQIVSYPAKATGTVTIPATVTTLGASAFEGTSISGIRFEGTLATIATRAFANCLSLIYVEMPEGVVTIGASAFLNCPIENEIVLPDTVTSIGANAFQNSTVPAINIPNKVQAIGNYAFQNSSLSKLTFDPNGTAALKIGSYAFQKTKITELVIPSRLRIFAPADYVDYAGNIGWAIGNYAFEGCEDLVSVTYEQGVNLSEAAILSFGKYSFANCTSLKSIFFPRDVKNLILIDQEGFQDNLVAIAEYAFSGCTSLESVEFENRLDTVSIGSYLFKNCTSLKTVVLNQWVEFLDRQGDPYFMDPNAEGVFYGCTSLVSVAMPAKGLVLPKYLFAGCTALEEVTGGFTQIADYAFDGCTALTTLESSETVTSLGSYAFRGCTLLNFSTAATSMTVGAYAFSGWTENQTVTFSGITAPTSRFNANWNADCAASIIWKIDAE